MKTENNYFSESKILKTASNYKKEKDFHLTVRTKTIITMWSHTIGYRCHKLLIGEENVKMLPDVKRNCIVFWTDETFIGSFEFSLTEEPQTLNGKQ